MPHVVEEHFVDANVCVFYGVVFCEWLFWWAPIYGMKWIPGCLSIGIGVRMAMHTILHLGNIVVAVGIKSAVE